MKETCEPPFSDWSGLLPPAPRRILNCGDTAIDVAGFRKKLLRAALRFQDEIIKTARAANLQTIVIEAARERAAASEVLVAAGHQPIIYHPGLLEKNLRLSRFCGMNGCTGLNIIIDADDSDESLLRYPARSGSGGLVLKQAGLASDHGLFLSSGLQVGASLRAVLRDASEGLRSSGRSAAAGRFEAAREAYEKLEGVPTVLAHTIVRSLYEPERNYLEIPFSWVLKEEEIKTISRLVLGKGRGFAELYNDTLHRHRDAHRIENPANPFPDLKVSPQGYELPLWVVDVEAGTRTPFQIREEAGGKVVLADIEGLPPLDHSEVTGIIELLEPRRILAPRGGLITVLLRTLCSDLFIHGLGGGHYDTFTETFAGRWLQTELCPFVLATATRHLFENEIREYEKLANWRSKIKDIYSHTQNYLGQEIFPEPVELELRRLSQWRADALGRLSGLAGKEAKRPILLELNDINRRVRDLIEATEWYSKVNSLEVDKPTLEAWYCREYPIFFFS